MTKPTPTAVITKYMEDRERINAIKRKAKEDVETIEAFQRKREDFLLGQDANNMDIFSFLVDLFINGRDGKAAKEQEKKDINLRQDAIEKWLLNMLGKHAKGIMTEHGTVYKTRKEGISVEDWGAFLNSEILRPAAEGVVGYIESEIGVCDAGVVSAIERILSESGHFEYLNHAVNKTACLEVMGEKDEKTEARPNPPPAGVKYTAFTTVGVRKK